MRSSFQTMSENHDEIRILTCDTIAGMSSYPSAMDLILKESQQADVHSESQFQADHGLKENGNLATEIPDPSASRNPNDSLSDDTHFEQQPTGSNENSNQPSPAKTGLVNNLETGIISTPFQSQTNILKSQQPSSAIDRDELDRVEATDKVDIEIDIAHFIDSFLGNDDLMQHAPVFTGGSDGGSVELGEVLITEKSAESETERDMQTSPVPIQNLAVVANVSSQANGRERVRSGNKATSSSTLVGRFPVKEIVAKKSEKRKPRTYTQAVPSQHCHICSRRPTEGSPHQICGNLLKGRCRKTICTKCFHQFRWDLKEAREAPPGTWECPHCRGDCPQRAQCVIYNRTSDRRRLKLINHRKRKVGAHGSREETGSPSCKRQIVEKSDSPNSGKTFMPPVPTFMAREDNTASGSGSKPQHTGSASKKKKTSGSKSKKPSKAEKAIKEAEPKAKRDKSARTQREGTELKQNIEAVEERQTSLMNEIQTNSFLDQEGAMQQVQGRQPLETNSNPLRHQEDPLVSHSNFDQVDGVLMANPASLVQEGVVQHTDTETPLMQSETAQTHLAHFPMISSEEFLPTDLNVHLAHAAITLEQNANRLQESHTNPMQERSICIEELLPKAPLAQKELEGSGQEGPEDLWILTHIGQEQTSNEPEQASTEPENDNILSLIGEDGPNGDDCPNERLGYRGNRGFGGL